MQNKVELCGVNTAKLKVLKNEETQELLRRSKAGDKQAREELIQGNLRLVLSVIHKFSNRGENVDDLFQVGCFRWGASALSRPLTISIPTWTCASPPTGSP